MTLEDLLPRFPGGAHKQPDRSYLVTCPVCHDPIPCLNVRIENGKPVLECRLWECNPETILAAIGLDSHFEPVPNNSGPDSKETPQETNQSNGTLSPMPTVSPGVAPSEPVGAFSQAVVIRYHEKRGNRGRFARGNRWAWKKGVSGNPKGRPRLHYNIPEGKKLRGVKLFLRFWQLYRETGNACRSAIEAGYALTTARSKSYLLARRAREAMEMGYLEPKSRTPVSDALLEVLRQPASEEDRLRFGLPREATRYDVALAAGLERERLRQKG
jgi:hypothetical protein